MDAWGKLIFWTQFFVLFFGTILLLLTVLSGFYGNSPVLSWQPWPSHHASDGVDTCCTDVTQQGRQYTSTKAEKKALHLNCHLSVRTVAALLCLKKQKDLQDTKEQRKQGKGSLHKLYDTRGLPGSPHLFLTSSQYIRCRITVFHSYCFSWSKARLTLVHHMYHKASSLVGATVLFCTFAVLFFPSSQTRHVSKNQALILSSFSLDTRLRPDRAASCPPELGFDASKTSSQLVSLCSF